MHDDIRAYNSPMRPGILSGSTGLLCSWAIPTSRSSASLVSPVIQSSFLSSTSCRASSGPRSCDSIVIPMERYGLRSLMVAGWRATWATPWRPSSEDRCLPMDLLISRNVSTPCQGLFSVPFCSSHAIGDTLNWEHCRRRGQWLIVLKRAPCRTC